MQRIAIGVVAATLFLFGCAERREPPGALPEPLMRTRSAHPFVIPRPEPTRPAPVPVPSKPAPSRYLAHTDGSLTPLRALRRGRWQVIVVHHSADADATPQSMHRFHLKQRGWANGLGYHFVIGNGVSYPDGRIFVGPRWSGQLTGAHCKAPAGRYFGVYRGNNFFNARGIGICLIGNFEHSNPTRAQIDALTELIEYLCKQAGISPNHVYGHGQITGRTACPGRRLAAKLASVRSDVARSLASNAGPSVRSGLSAAR